MSTRTLPYQPALDGVRAFAVTTVLVFHGGWSWMTGGYVGVSVFFTLSGYLITALLLVEHERSGTIRLGRFYARRMKRLLPASVVCLGAVAVGAAAGWFDATRSLRRDLLGASLQVANWVKLAGDASYADLTDATLGRVAPLEHYWSLAIEEQFYWVWPVTLLVLFRMVSPRAVRASIVVLAVLAGLTAPVVAAVWGGDAAYWSTPARAGEILVGAATAVALHRRPADRLPTWSVALAPLGAAVVVWAAVTWPADHGPAYEGWLPVFALASAALVVGLQRPSPWRRWWSARPVAWVGTISYGLYLYHWPLFASITEDRVGVGGVALFGVRLAATFVVAAASSRWLEVPVRRWEPTWPRPLVVGAVATVALVVLAAAIVPTGDGTPLSADDADAAAASIAPVEGSLAPLATVTPEGEGVSTSSSAVATVPAATDAMAPVGAVTTDVPVPDVTRPVRVVVVGDSTAQVTAAGLTSWAAAHPEAVQVADASQAGCGFLRSGEVATDGEIDWQGQCDEALDVRLPPLLDELRPDVVMLMVTMRDVEDRSWDPAEGVLSPFDPRYRQRLLDDYVAFATRLRDAGVPRVAWVLPPHPIAPFQGEQVKMLDPARYEVQFDVIEEVAARFPDLIEVLDVRAWLTAVGGDRDGERRPDGIHWSADAGVELADRFLAGSLVSIALAAR